MRERTSFIPYLPKDPSGAQVLKSKEQPQHYRDQHDGLFQGIDGLIVELEGGFLCKTSEPSRQVGANESPEGKEDDEYECSRQKPSELNAE